ncbi:fimbrial biogenesis chaperone [Enterobacter cloacae]
MKIPYPFQFLLLSLCIIPQITGASIIINGTRFIYPQNEKDIIVKMSNNGQEPVLVQAWIDKGDMNAKPDSIDVPFVVLPPINRINSRQSKTLKIKYNGQTLPGDRESIFWLNVHEVPVKTTLQDQSYLQFAFRSRLKLFYRPTALMGKAEDAQKKLVWSCSNGRCDVKNNSGYYISLIEFELHAGDRRIKQNADMVSPFSTRSFTVRPNTAGSVKSYTYLNDWGAIKTQTIGQ